MIINVKEPEIFGKITQMPSFFNAKNRAEEDIFRGIGLFFKTSSKAWRIVVEVMVAGLIALL